MGLSAHSSRCLFGLNTLIHYKIGMMLCTWNHIECSSSLITLCRHVLVLWVSRSDLTLLFKFFYFYLFLDGIAAATLRLIINYLLLGLSLDIDQFYLHSFKILLLVLLFFLVLGIWGIYFWSIGWDSRIFLHRCLRIYGSCSCKFFILKFHWGWDSGILLQQCLRNWDGFCSCKFLFLGLIVLLGLILVF